MPFSVSCKSCGSRFLMGDDLFRRKVAGKVVTVRCRHCSAEINVDASDSDPRPLPPRPPRPGALEGRLVALSPGLMNAPEPARAEPGDTLRGLKSPELEPNPPQEDEEPTGIEDEFVEELPPSVPSAAEAEADADADADAEPEPEPEIKSQDFVPPPEPPEPPISEPPPSSSGTPSLHALTGSLHHEPPKSRRDDFELAFGSSSTVLGLGPPTIDVSSLVTSPKEQATDHQGAPTVPLFDMTTGLDSIPEQARSDAPTSSEAPKPKRRRESEAPSSQDGKRKRKRKKVVAPPQPAQATSSRSEPPNRSGSVLWAAIAALGIAGGGAWFLRDRAAPEPSSPPPQAAAAPAPTPTPLPTPAPAPVAEPTATAPAAAAPVAPAAAAGPAEPAPAPGPKPEAAAKPEQPAGAAPATTPAAASAPTTAAASATPAAEAPSDAPAVTDPFNKNAAIAALQSAAAEAASCRQPGDPSGTANVVVTFAPSGRVTTANVSGIFAGTPTGGCVASKLRRAKVPPFAGEHTTVSKTVVLQ